MKLTLAPFQAAHLAELDLPAAREWWDRIKAAPEIGAAYEVDGLAWTLLIDDRVAACAGIRPAFQPDPAPGQGEVWSLFPPRLPRGVWKAVLHACRRVLETAEARGYRRLEAYVRADNRFGFQLTAKLDFEVEALMRRWGPMDADTLLMARVVARPAAAREEQEAA